MTYFVTHGTKPAGLDQVKDLESALAHACSLIAEGYVNVAIQDGSGREISGADLIACCNGEKTLAADLRAN